MPLLLGFSILRIPIQSENPSATWEGTSLHYSCRPLFVDGSSLRARSPHIPLFWFRFPQLWIHLPLQHPSHCFACLSLHWAVTSTRPMAVFPSLCTLGPRTPASAQWMINLCCGIKCHARARRDLRDNPVPIQETEAQTGEAAPPIERELVVTGRGKRERNQRCQQCLRNQEGEGLDGTWKG